jgi:hypothetical protein
MKISPLYLAVKSKNEKMVELLLKNRARIKGKIARTSPILKAIDD